MKRRGFLAGMVGLVLAPLGLQKRKPPEAAGLPYRGPIDLDKCVAAPEYFYIMMRDPDETVDPKAPYGLAFWIHGKTPLLRVPWKEWEAVKHLPRPMSIEVRRRLWRVGVQVSELKFERVDAAGRSDHLGP